MRCGVIEALARTDIADQRVVGINADALMQGKTLPFGRLGIELVQAVAAAQGGVDRALRMVRIVDRRAEYRNDGVADIFVDEAALKPARSEEKMVTLRRRPAPAAYWR